MDCAVLIQMADLLLKEYSDDMKASGELLIFSYGDERANTGGPRGGNGVLYSEVVHQGICMELSHSVHL
jgi:hypothetical protein